MADPIPKPPFLNLDMAQSAPYTTQWMRDFFVPHTGTEGERLLCEVKGVVIHYTGGDNHTLAGVAATLKNNLGGSQTLPDYRGNPNNASNASWQFAIGSGFDGRWASKVRGKTHTAAFIMQCTKNPNTMCYHCGHTPNGNNSATARAMVGSDNCKFIAIEHCSKGPQFLFTAVTLNASKHLVHWLAQEFGFPITSVVSRGAKGFFRHADMSGKACPKGYVSCPDDGVGMRSGDERWELLKTWYMDKTFESEPPAECVAPPW